MEQTQETWELGKASPSIDTWDSKQPRKWIPLLEEKDWIREFKIVLKAISQFQKQKGMTLMEVELVYYD